MNGPEGLKTTNLASKLFLHSPFFRPIQRDPNENHPLLRRLEHLGL